MDAAAALFLEQGFAATTLNDVVRRSGGSLATLYALFGSKVGLLAEMVAERCERMAAVVENVELAGLGPADSLREVSRHLFTQLSDPTGIALLRIVIAEAPNLPEIGRRFYDAGPATGRRTMAAYLASLAARGELDVPDPEEAATMFFHMLLGEHQMRMLCALPLEFDGTRDEHIERTVARFLKLHGNRA